MSVQWKTDRKFSVLLFLKWGWTEKENHTSFSFSLLPSGRRHWNAPDRQKLHGIEIYSVGIRWDRHQWGSFFFFTEAVMDSYVCELSNSPLSCLFVRLHNLPAIQYCSRLAPSSPLPVDSQLELEFHQVHGAIEKRLREREGWWWGWWWWWWGVGGGFKMNGSADNKSYCGFLMYFDSFHLCQRQTHDSCFWPRGPCIRRYTFPLWGHAWTGPKEHTHTNTHSYRKGESQSSRPVWLTVNRNIQFIVSQFLFAPVCCSYLTLIMCLSSAHTLMANTKVRNQCIVFNGAQGHVKQQPPACGVYTYIYLKVTTMQLVAIKIM